MFVKVYARDPISILDPTVNLYCHPSCFYVLNGPKKRRCLEAISRSLAWFCPESSPEQVPHSAAPLRGMHNTLAAKLPERQLRGADGFRKRDVLNHMEHMYIQYIMGIPTEIYNICFPSF